MWKHLKGKMDALCVFSLPRVATWLLSALLVYTNAQNSRDQAPRAVLFPFCFLTYPLMSGPILLTLKSQFQGLYCPPPRK